MRAIERPGIVFAGGATLHRDVNLHQLELFYHVARSGGISRALRHIPYGIQQPAVSIQILALEEHLGVKLFERKPFRLTAEGRELFDVARPFFEQLDAVEARLQRKQAPSLRVAASELVLRDYLPAVMDEMKRRQPELRFRLRSGLQAEMERWLLDGEIDLAITPLDKKPTAGLRAEPLARLPLVLLVPAGSDVKSAAQLWERGTIREPLICLPPGESITQSFQAGLRQLQVDWPIAIEASSTDLVTRYVANGYGLGVTVDMPDFVAARGVRALPLPGFAPIVIMALWCKSAQGVQAMVREVVVRQAAKLFPGGERSRRS